MRRSGKALLADILAVASFIAAIVVATCFDASDARFLVIVAMLWMIMAEVCDRK